LSAVNVITSSIITVTLSSINPKNPFTSPHVAQAYRLMNLSSLAYSVSTTSGLGLRQPAFFDLLTML
jgi:hypothetical protein